MDDARSCPYCTRRLDAVPEGFSRDHVVPRALGGTATVRACRPCNSRIGHDIEAPLLAPGTLLAFRRHAAGLDGRPLQAVDASDETRLMSADLVGGTGAVPRSGRVTYGRDEDGRETARIEGTVEQGREALRGFRRRGVWDLPPTDEEVLRSAHRWKPSPTVRFDATLSLPLAQRLLAKVALGAGTLLWDGRFAGSVLAVALRTMLWVDDGGWREDAVSADPALLDLQFEVLVDAGLPDRRVPPFRLDAPNVSQLTFVPLYERRATVVLLHLHGAAIPLRGLVLDGRLDGTVLPSGLTERQGSRAELWASDRDLSAIRTA